MKKDVVLGITGGFGTGKSTVAKMFGKLGAVVISADEIAHDVISPGGPGYRKVVSVFGNSILKKNKTIDRRKLARIVFADKKKLTLLNSIIHPEARLRIEGIISVKELIERKGLSAGAVYIIDAPVLIEAGWLDMVDKLIVVTSDRDKQVKRCVRKWGLSKADVDRRIRSQMTLEDKRHLADFIIDNNGTLVLTKKRVEEVWEEIEQWCRKR